MRLRILVRLLTIQRALVRHGLDDFIRATHLYSPFRFLFYLSPWTWFQRSAGITRGERLRLALEELGPIFVKFGQAVSTRRDLIPLDIADELAKLQDRVPPFGSDVAVAAIESALGAKLGDIFAGFDPEPLAAASVAQVHGATLKSGEDVVVKILRPGMHAVIDLDLEVLDALAALANEYWEDARRLRPIEIVREYRKTILDELDLMREAANAAQLKRNFAGSSLLYVPDVYWDYCRVNVMVMERIHGVIVSRMDELRARGANIAKLAENGVEIFFTQVFRHNFFHADMHPGNIFVQLDDPENPRSENGLSLTIARLAIFPTIRKKIGPNLKALICGSAPLSRETQLFFMMLGIPVLQAYGLTETTAICTLDIPGKVEPGWVGSAVPGIEMKLGADEEILVRGPNIFPGYWNRPEETANALRDGWFHTGDQGELNANGNWRIIGRIKNLLVLSSGHNVAPEPIEEKLLAAIPGAQQVVLIGHGRSYLTAIVAGDVNRENVSKEIETMNAEQPHYKRIHGFHVESQPFTMESGLMTANGKLRRNAIAEHFVKQIEALYREKRA